MLSRISPATYAQRVTDKLAAGISHFCDDFVYTFAMRERMEQDRKTKAQFDVAMIDAQKMIENQAIVKGCKVRFIGNDAPFQTVEEMRESGSFCEYIRKRNSRWYLRKKIINVIKMRDELSEQYKELEKGTDEAHKIRRKIGSLNLFLGKLNAIYKSKL